MTPSEIPAKFIHALRRQEFINASAGAPAQIDYACDPLGCGAYGCVFRTNKTGIVLKLTSDENEYRIASKYSLGGIVKYYKTADIGVGIYALWREEGYVMSDVHIDNIGYAIRNGRRVWVIVDPGHCVNLLD